MPAQQPTTLTFATQAEWDAWLARHGGSDGASAGVWLRFAKAKAPADAEPTLSYAQALESALCHGWIDGLRQAESAHHWRQRFTPRAVRQKDCPVCADAAQRRDAIPLSSASWSSTARATAFAGP